jgi:hypothetical protein
LGLGYGLSSLIIDGLLPETGSRNWVGNAHAADLTDRFAFDRAERSRVRDAFLAARRTEASGGTIGGDFGLRGLAGALDLPRTAV